MLQKENLCSLHQQHGPEMLPHTCATYPRAVSTNSGQTETALHLSCPEAARVTLLDPNLLGDFATAGLPAGGDPVWPDAATHRYARFGPAPARPDRLYDPGLALREYVLLLLTDRRYPLWQRLYLAGILARRIDIARGDSTASAWCADNPARVAKLLADSARTLVLDRLRPVMDGFHADPAQQLQLLIEILRLRLDQPGVPARFMECVRDFQLGLGCTTAAGEQQILSAYAEAHSRYYLPLLHRHPHILENYLANYVFKNHYPFGRPRTMPLAPGDTPDAQSEHLLLCAHAALAQMLLIGMAGRYGKAFALEHVIQLMQSLARTIEHSPHFLEQVPILLRQKNLLNLRGIAVLTRHDA
jgi:lysine-N-methylase